MKKSRGPMRPVFDEGGNLLGFEKVRPVVNSEGYREFRKQDEKREVIEVAEGKGDPKEVVDVECEGMSEEDIQAEKRYKEEEKQKILEQYGREETQLMLKQWEKYVENMEAFNKRRREEKAKTLNG